MFHDALRAGIDNDAGRSSGCAYKRVCVSRAHRDEGESGGWRSQRWTVGNIRRGSFPHGWIGIYRHQRQQLDDANRRHGAARGGGAMTAASQSVLARAATVFGVHQRLDRSSVLALIGPGRGCHRQGPHFVHRVTDGQVVGHRRGAVHRHGFAVHRQNHQQQPRESRQNPKERRTRDRAE